MQNFDNNNLCQACNGEGYREDYHTPDQNFLAEEKVICSYCGGTGKAKGSKG